MDADEQVLCPDPLVATALSVVQGNDEAGLSELERLLKTYPNDPRLHFLKGSVLAGIQRYEEGRAAMQQAVAIAPGYELARFQLGFLELTSGMPADAEATWAAFAQLDEAAPFRLLSSGLNALAQDDFAEADRLVKLGMKANTEHPLVNGDMQLLLDEVRDTIAVAAPAEPPIEEPGSAAHQLLQHFELKDSISKLRH